MFVLEDMVIRKYATGKQTSGNSWILTGGSGFATLKQVIVQEKHLKVLKKKSVFVAFKFTSLKDGDDENRAADSGKS